MTENAHGCDHCGALVAASAAVRDGDGVYCCSGCAGAATIIREGGFETWYARREGPANRPEAIDARAFDQPAFRASHVRSVDDGAHEVDFQVDGITCAACTWLVERAVSDLPGVEDCRVSYGTGRARIRWNDASIPLSTIVERIAALGYRPQAARTERRLDPDLISRAGFAGFAAMNVMALSFANYAGWFDGMEELYAALFRWGSLLLATPAALWSAQPFFRRAWDGLRLRMVHMDLPIALGIAVLYGHGLIAVLLGSDGYLDSMTMLIALLLLGRLAEEAGRTRAEEAENAILAEAPSSARRLLPDGTTEDVPVDALARGDRLLVAPGHAIPIDAVVVDGALRIDASLVTGESEPVEAEPGVQVWAGTSVVSGSAVIETRAEPSDTLLTAMARRVAEARLERTPAHRLADRLAPWFTGLTLAVAFGAFAAWWILADLHAALPVLVAVLVVACPCAITLGISSAYASGLAAAARRGAFLRDGEVLDRLADVTDVFVDKTGTLTEGRPSVESASDRALALATGLERGSAHPVARAVLDEAARRRIPIRAGLEIEELPGVGIRGRVDGHRVELRAGSQRGVDVVVDGERIDTIVLRDRLRPDARRALERIPLPTHILTGDAAEATQRIATQLDTVRWTPRMKPEEKADRIRSERAQGRLPLFLGDGLNDAPAIAEAHVGAAMASGASASVLAADVVLIAGRMEGLAHALATAHETRRTLGHIRRVSIFYNVGAVGAAAVGLVNPLVAAILMPISSLTVVAIALGIDRRLERLERTYEDRIPVAPTVDPDGGGVRLRLHESGA